MQHIIYIYILVDELIYDITIFFCHYLYIYFLSLNNINQIYNI